MFICYFFVHIYSAAGADSLTNSTRGTILIKHMKNLRVGRIRNRLRVSSHLCLPPGAPRVVIGSNENDGKECDCQALGDRSVQNFTALGVHIGETKAKQPEQHISQSLFISP